MSNAAQVWDIVRVGFPLVDTNTVRVRPGLVIATPSATDTFGIVWVLMITSARHQRWPDDIVISDLSSTGLPHPSVIRTGKIAAIDSRVAAPVGRLTEADREAVRQRLKQHFGPALAV